MEPNDEVYDNISSLITTPYIHYPENDKNTHIFIVKNDIEKFDQNLLLGNSVVNSFLRWISSQSNKISVIDSTSMVMKNLQDDKNTKVRENISTQNLILIQIAKGVGGHWFIYLLIRSSKKLFMLILLYLIYKNLNA